MNEAEIRKLLAEYGRKLAAAGLVQGTWGNLSIRLDDAHMIVTPSGLDYQRLTQYDMVKVEIETLKYEGSQKPTSEKGLHGGIYAGREEIGAVIHTHSKYCSIFAAADMPVPVEKEDIQEVFGQFVNTAKYGLPGTKALMKNTIAALGNNYGCIMANHGMICCGRDIEEAFSNCLLLEECCRDYIESRYERAIK